MRFENQRLSEFLREIPRFLTGLKPDQECFNKQTLPYPNQSSIIENEKIQFFAIFIRIFTRIQPNAINDAYSGN